MTLLELAELETKYYLAIAPLQDRLKEIEEEGMENRYFQKWYAWKINSKTARNTTVPNLYFELNGNKYLIDDNISTVRQSLSDIKEKLVSENVGKTEMKSDSKNIVAYDDFTLADSALSMAELYSNVNMRILALNEEYYDIKEINKPGMTSQKYIIKKMCRDNYYFNGWYYFNVVDGSDKISTIYNSPEFTIQGIKLSFLDDVEKVCEKLNEKILPRIFSGGAYDELSKCVVGYNYAFEYYKLEKQEKGLFNISIPGAKANVNDSGKKVIKIKKKKRILDKVIYYKKVMNIVKNSNGKISKKEAIIIVSEQMGISESAVHSGFYARQYEILNKMSLKISLQTLTKPN